MSALWVPIAQAQGQGKDRTVPFQIVETSIDDIHAAFKSGKLTARRLVQGYLDRINAYDKAGPTINSVITINPNALEEADKLDAAYKRAGPVGPLHGIPVLVKDEIDTAGMPTTLGTLVFKDYRPPRDAFAIEKLRKAGAIILGKTTLSEFAAGDTYGSMFGVTRNPYDLERTVGGSSGGPAPRLRQISRPSRSERNGCIDPPAGRLECGGQSASHRPGQSQRHVGRLSDPTCADGPDGAHRETWQSSWTAWWGYDPEDPVTALGVGKVEGSYVRFLDRRGLKGARIGILRESIGNNSDPASADFKAVDAAFEKNVAELKAAGAVLVDPIVIPNLKALLAKRAPDPNAADAALKLYLARNPNSPFKTREDYVNSPDMEKSFPPPNVTRWKTPPAPFNAARYAEYLQSREELMIGIAKVMADNKLDAIVHKSVEHQPTLIKEGVNPPYTSTRGVPTWNTFLVYAASMTVPSGFDADNLPVGITFFGLPYSEPMLLKLAYAYEQATATGCHPRPPALPSNGWFRPCNSRASWALRQIQPQMQLAELLGRGLGGRAHHEVLGTLVHREQRDFAQIGRATQQHHNAVDAGRHTAVRRRAILERAVHAAETFDHVLLAVAGDFKRFHHRVGPVVADAAGGDLIAIADDVVLKRLDGQGVAGF
jgi:Asp-tRNA(Asn)/Glu-tRNA(Gln) amidotransferase A subunit family amidase